jgi:anaerobic carbon-monoxide dehydrogenase iron sulfur subunit
MKNVVVHPERCVGCMQCMIACSVAHSVSLDPFEALMEPVRPRPRVHVGAGPTYEGFPNRCRHCNPAPCLSACLPGAIYRSAETGSVLIDADRCINCASCAMACPFGVIRYHHDPWGPPGRVVAVKCDNCVSRQALGKIPACVDVCKTGALTFEETDEAMRRKTGQVSWTVWSEPEESRAAAAGFDLLRAIKKAEKDLACR